MLPGHRRKVDVIVRPLLSHRPKSSHRSATRCPRLWGTRSSRGGRTGWACTAAPEPQTAGASRSPKSCFVELRRRSPRPAHRTGGLVQRSPPRRVFRHRLQQGCRCPAAHSVRRFDEFHLATPAFRASCFRGPWAATGNRRARRLIRVDGPPPVRSVCRLPQTGCVCRPAGTSCLVPLVEV